LQHEKNGRIDGQRRTLQGIGALSLAADDIENCIHKLGAFGVVYKRAKRKEKNRVSVE
jgi:hypothetical protein